MAKRRRLIPFDPDAVPPLAMLHPHGGPGSQRPPGPAPIAAVAGETSMRAALDELADEMGAARSEGRMIQSVPLDQIKSDHLVRDRMTVDAVEMEALVSSLRARGQQMPIEVVGLDGGRFGLISGWRRFRALQRLHAETGDARFAGILAFVRAPATAADAYLAMVEENEIRAGISYYERARLAAEAVRIGIHPDTPRAIAALYAGASASKRSKIANFVTVHAELGSVLRFGPAIPERLGLALSAALQEDGFGTRLREVLRDMGAEEGTGDDAGDAASERLVLEQALRNARRAPRTASKKSRGEELAPGLFLEAKAGTGGRSGRAILSGPAFDTATLAALRDWLKARN